MKTRISILLLFITIFKLEVNAQTLPTFVTINYTCGFSDNWGNWYRPLVCNYIINFAKDYSNSPTYPLYISPDADYSNIWTCYNSGTCNNDYLSNHGIWAFADNPWTNDYEAKTNATNKLALDLQNMKNLGFTEIRLCGASMTKDSSGVYIYPTGETVASGGPNYFSLLDGFMTQVNNAGLRVIFLLGAGTEVISDINNYKNYLAAVADHFQNNQTIMAYDLYNEPTSTLWPLENNGTDPNSFNKYNFTKLFTELNTTVKAKDRNHLTTISFFGPSDITTCDPTMLPIDFVSFHFYSNTNDTSITNNMMKAFYYWAGKTINVPWIIGETSYAANDTITGNAKVGSTANQNTFAANTLQWSVDCNCKGYSWWQYQDVTWGGNNTVDNFQGLYYKYTGLNGGVYDYGKPKTIANSSSPFKTYQTLNKGGCSIPTNYYSIFNGASSNPTISGFVKDNSGVAIANAVVLGKDKYSTISSTFTDANGAFTLHSLSDTTSITQITSSSSGYSTYFKVSPANGDVYSLTKANYNSWVKEYSNSSKSGYLNAISGTDWHLSNTDKFYKGDFNGDGQQDLLCVQNTGGNSDRMAIFSYSYNFPTLYSEYTIQAGWNVIWDNNSNPNNGGGIYPYRSRLTVGNFDGTGGDDIISIGDGGFNWTTWFTFVGGTNGWLWMDSDNGSTGSPAHKQPMAGIAGYNTNFIAGRFYGGTKDAIIGIAYPNTSYMYMTSFQINSSGSWQWKESNNGSSGGSLTPLNTYTAQFIPGDFDGDGTTEILAIAPSTGGMAIYQSNNGSNWTQKWQENYGSNTDMFPYTGNLQVGNFDNDASDEILGLNNTYCVTFDFAASSTPWTINWDGGTKTSISDWNISSNFANGKYLFLNTDKNAYQPSAPLRKQQQLLTLNSSTQAANLYSFAPVLWTENVEGSYPCSTLRLANPNSAGILENNKPDDIIKIYPNPNTGSFTIETITTTKQTLQVYDITGKIVHSQIINGTTTLNLGALSEGIYNLSIISNEGIVNKRLIIAR